MGEAPAQMRMSGAGGSNPPNTAARTPRAHVLNCKRMPSARITREMRAATDGLPRILVVVFIMLTTSRVLMGLHHTGPGRVCGARDRADVPRWAARAQDPRASAGSRGTHSTARQGKAIAPGSLACILARKAMGLFISGSSAPCSFVAFPHSRQLRLRGHSWHRQLALTAGTDSWHNMRRTSARHTR